MRLNHTFPALPAYDNSTDPASDYLLRLRQDRVVLTLLPDLSGGMDATSEAAGVNIISRCYALPPDYPDPNVPCAYVEIYWRAVKQEIAHATADPKSGVAGFLEASNNCAREVSKSVVGTPVKLL